MDEDQELQQLVVIGSSAGGIEALSTLVASLPQTFPVPVLIAQHLDPTRPSHLADILARRATLPVRTLIDHAPLKPGVIFVVPANRHVEMSDHDLRLLEDTISGPKPSIDLLFSSAAERFGEGLIAVILTGTGSDGAAGARSVKDAGGTVLIQNPATARYPSMPMSLAPTTVDIVADVENIGGVLQDLLTGAYHPSQPSEDPTLRVFLDHLRDRSGIDFSNYKAPTIGRRLQRRMVATGSGRLSDYFRYMEANPEEYLRLVNSFLIKVTEFFRDTDLFTYLRDHVVPQIIAEGRRHGNEIRVWSAGCATGEEAYSLAILLSDVLGEEISEFNIRIFATDLDEAAVNFARRGIYPSSALDGLPPDLISRYFSETDGEYEVKKPVRGLIVFGQHDLGQRAPFPHTDLVLCRNVLIYFAPELQKRALQLFAFSLRDGGFLVLGKAETTGALPEFFVLEHHQMKIYRRHGERVQLLPPARIVDLTGISPRSGVPRRSPPSPAVLRPDREQHGAPDSERAEMVLQRLPAGVVIVDRRYAIRFINASARELLSIHGAAIGEDLVHLAPDTIAPRLRAGIDAALRTGQLTVVGEVPIEELETGRTRYLHFACQASPGEDGPTETVSVVVTDTTDEVQARQESEAARTEAQASAARLTDQLRQFAEARTRLLEANQGLTAENAELRSANEEFLVGNEELQATTEEVETLNEELQATNEELETLNEELQATVEELNTTNDDLQARSVELMELASSREDQRRVSDAERTRFETVLVSMGDAVIVVDRDGRPILTNAVYDETFATTENEVVFEDEDGQPFSPASTLHERAARGESFSMPFEMWGPSEEHHWFEATGRPINSEAAGLGGVVVIRDISERSILHLQEEFTAMATHELRTPLAAVLAYVELLVRNLDAESERREYLANQALDATRRLTGHVQDLVDVERIQSRRLTLTSERVELQSLLERTVEISRALAPSQAVGLVVDPSPLVVDGEKRRLEQVILNLLTNAFTHAPDSPQVDVQLSRVGEAAEIVVRDYGPGIPESDLPSLFSRFYQVQRTGRPSRGSLGLGLFIAREIITAHEGTIRVDSHVGKGTMFTVRLPLAPPEPF